MGEIRRCTDRDREHIGEIINEAAVAYRGSIPPDCWHEPYMSGAQLASDIDAGVIFWGYEDQGKLVGVMGIQPVDEVDLIRHAYVVSGQQRGGVGTALIQRLLLLTRRRLLVGTWAAAAWAIRFYQRQGFILTDASATQQLLKTYWNIPARQAHASVVLDYAGAQPSSCAIQ
jgi:GNAT superfamily N-acetyltransferase